MNEKKRTVRAVVFGAGSIGKRHISNFVVNGCTHLTIVEPRSERHGEVEKLLVDLDTGYARPSINFLIDHSSISENPEFDLGIICAPPKWHLELIDMCRERNIPILCEKPLFKDSDDWAAVKQTVNRVHQSGLFNMVAYNYRFCSGLLKFKEILRSGRIGKIVSFRGNFSENVRDWHPWEGLNFYMSSIDQGGGALLDESHLLDICRWLFGEPTSVCAVNGTYSALKSEEIFETDDLVEVVAEFPESVVGSIHMDLYGKHHNKMLEVVGEEGTAYWFFDNFDLESNRIEVWKGVRNVLSDENKKRIADDVYGSDMSPRNQMYFDMAAYAMNALCSGAEERRDVPNLVDGLKTMEFVRAVRRSSQTRRFEPVEQVNL